MNLDNIIKLLERESINYTKYASLKNLNSFKVNAYASLLTFPDTKEKLCLLVSLLNSLNLSYLILGNGTNVVFLNKLYDGVVVSTKLLNNIIVKNNVIEADCGASATSLSKIALNNYLSGLEFCYGLPGSVGGIVYMNASAYGSQVSDIIVCIEYFDYSKNKICCYTQNDNIFDTKMSIFQINNGLILNAKFKLSKKNYNYIYERMNEYFNKRKSTQPLELPSAGSVFKRPKNSFASKLIDEAGLKGKRVGDAQVSLKHAGFIVNLGSATGEEIYQLTQYIKNDIYQRFNVELEEEIIFIK